MVIVVVAASGATYEVFGSGIMQFYCFVGSPPCRTVLLFLQAINIQPEMIDINLGVDNLAPEFVQMNPQHTIPLIVDNNFVLSESRAILGYLADKYGKSMEYYPSDPQARAIVNQRLMFDIGVLYQLFEDTYSPVYERGEEKRNEEAFSKVGDALGMLQQMMGDSPYIAGEKITIADFSLVVTISTLESFGAEISHYPLISTWYNKCKTEMAGYEVNEGGTKMLAEFTQSLIKS